MTFAVDLGANHLADRELGHRLRQRSQRLLRYRHRRWEASAPPDWNRSDC